MTSMFLMFKGKENISNNIRSVQLAPSWTHIMYQDPKKIPGCEDKIIELTWGFPEDNTLAEGFSYITAYMCPKCFDEISKKEYAKKAGTLTEDTNCNECVICKKAKPSKT